MRVLTARNQSLSVAVIFFVAISVGAQRKLPAQLAIPDGLISSGMNFDRFEYDGFRQMLQSRKIKVDSFHFKSALRRPRDTVMVIMGDTTKLHAMESRIYTFYKKGGALLVANDQTDHKFLFDFRTFFNASTSNFSPTDTLRNFEDCPLVTDLDIEAPLLFDNVNMIVTNRPGYLSFRDGDAQSYSAAWLPPSKTGMSESFLAIRHYKNTSGRMLVLADHSVFTNQMLLHGSNLAFANNVVDWLCASGSRKRLIFIRDGEVMPKYSIGSQLPPIPPEMLLDAMDDILDKARPNLFDSSFREFTNKAIRSLQDKDFFNYALIDRQSRIKPSFVRRGSAIVFAALVVSVLLVRMITGRKRESRFKVRHASKRRDHSATARLLIRDFFVHGNLTDRPYDARPVAVSNRWWRRRRLQRHLRQLWFAGTAELPKRTSAKQLEKLRNQLKRMNDLRDGGQLTIQWEQ